MTWGDFFTTLLAGGAAATAAFATYRVNQEAAAIRAEQEAGEAQQHRQAGSELDPLDPRLWRHGVPPEFLRGADEQDAAIRSRAHLHGPEATQDALRAVNERQHAGDAFGYEHLGDSWGTEPDDEQDAFSRYVRQPGSSSQHRMAHDMHMPGAAGMDTFEELFSFMHAHMMGSRLMARRSDPADVLSDMRSRGHPELWDSDFWGDLGRVHEVMMGRLGNLHAAAAAAGVQSGEVLDPLALQLSLMDRDFNEADYEMLSRLDDPARGPANRAPLTESQLSELPTHTFQARRGSLSGHPNDSGPERRNSLDASCSKPSTSSSGPGSGTGNGAGKSSIWSKTKAVLTSRGSSKFQGSNPSSRDAAAEAEAACQSCSICLDEFQPGEGVMTLPCAHQFHAQCVGHWLKQEGQAGTCPVCKHPVWQQAS